MHIDPISWWTSEVSAFAPIGHVLRMHMHDKWTRFHSLPASKRYAESDAEHQEILKRNFAVASELFDVGEPIYIYRCHPVERKLKGKQKHILVGNPLRENMMRLHSGLNMDEEDQYCVRALVTSWTPAFFNLLTQQVAESEETGITFVSPTTKNIYCPYDGGMDVFLHTDRLSTLETKFSSWMSSREDKL